MNTLDNFQLPAGLPDIQPGAKFQWKGGQLAGEVVKYQAAIQNDQNQWVLEFDRGSKVLADELYIKLIPVSESHGQQNTQQDVQQNMPMPSDVNLDMMTPNVREQFMASLQQQPQFDRHYNIPEGYDKNEIQKLVGGRKSRLAEGLGVPPVSQKVEKSPIELLLDENDDFDEVSLAIKILPKLPSKELVSVITKSFKNKNSKRAVLDYVMASARDSLLAEVSEKFKQVLCDHYGFDKSELEPPKIEEELENTEPQNDTEFVET